MLWKSYLPIELLGGIASSRSIKTKYNTMKRVAVVLTLGCVLLTTLLTSGCVASIGNRSPGITVGQQLIDLQKAKDAGAITEAEFQTEKAKLLGTK